MFGCLSFARMLHIIDTNSLSSMIHCSDLGHLTKKHNFICQFFVSSRSKRSVKLISINTEMCKKTHSTLTADASIHRSLAESSDLILHPANLFL